jgi:solute carrier family 45, member 1/2/4
MASRIVGLGNIIGYVAGYVDLSNFAWWLGNTQFKQLCAIASIALTATVVLSCLTIRERDPRLEGPPPADRPGVLSFFGKIFVSIKRLPPQIKKVCTVQFFAWIGFFPMLFYTSSYIGEIYVEPYLEENPNMTPEELDELYERATRVGTFALLIYSIVSLVTNVFLPFFIAPTYDSHPIPEAPDAGPAAKPYMTEERSWLDYLIIPGFTLRRAWMLSLLLFTGSMLCTVFVRTVEAATFLIGLVGITWALTLWAPWAIISAEISRRDALIRSQKHTDGHFRSVATGPDGSSDEDVDDESQGDESEEVDQAGVILGIHNMAIAAPQMIATVISSIIFRVFQKPRGTPGDHSIAVVLALGGVTVLLAAYFVHRIQDEVVLPVDETSAIEEGESPIAVRPSHSRSQSFEQRSRKSLERATLVRQSSYGGGLEY